MPRFLYKQSLPFDYPRCKKASIIGPGGTMNKDDRRYRFMKKLFVLTLLMLAPFSAYAQWNLSNDDSSVNIISVKKSAVGEVHSFKKISGTIKDDMATVIIDLSSVETNIPIRNERMKTLLFDVAHFSTASISSEIKKDELTRMKVGDIRRSRIDLEVNLHGVTKRMEVGVQIIKLNDNRILVASTSPFILNAGDFNLADGVNALRKVAKLPSISTAVPVSFSLLFTR